MKKDFARMDNPDFLHDIQVLGLGEQPQELQDFSSSECRATVYTYALCALCKGPWQRA